MIELKSLRGLMVSDFVTEHDGLLVLTDELKLFMHAEKE